MRHPARGAGALERRTADDHGDLVYMFARPWSNGATGIKLSPLELLEKLAAIVPLPRVHLVRYGGSCLCACEIPFEIVLPPFFQTNRPEAFTRGNP